MKPDVERGESALALLRSWCSSARIETPTIPDHLVGALRSPDGPFVTTDGTRWDAFGGYGLEFGFGVGARVRPELGAYRSAAMPDYFIAGGKDNGYSTMWGFAVRSGGLFASVQLKIGDAMVDGPPSHTQRVMQAYNRLLAPMLGEADRPLNTCVLFSAYRNCAGVLTTYEPAWLDAQPSSRPLLEAPPGWGYATELTGDDDFTATQVTDGDAPEELRAGVDFLNEVANYGRTDSDD
jgi:hypothetical protein